VSNRLDSHLNPVTEATKDVDPVLSLSADRVKDSQEVAA